MNSNELCSHKKSKSFSSVKVIQYMYGYVCLIFDCTYMCIEVTLLTKVAGTKIMLGFLRLHFISETYKTFYNVADA